MMTTQLDAAPDERTRRLLLRKAIRSGRVNGRRRIHQKDLAAATGISTAELSYLLSGRTPLSVQRWRQLMRAIETLTGGGERQGAGAVLTSPAPSRRLTNDAGDAGAGYFSGSAPPPATDARKER